MARNVGIPKLGLTMTEATIVEWKVAEKASVQQEEPILVIETEKTTYDIGAIASGILHIMVPAGETVPVGHVVGVLAESEAEYEGLLKGAPAAAASAPAQAEAPAPAASSAASAPASAPVGAPAAEGERVRISPVARVLAEEHGVDLARVAGTGPGGRITKEDVQRAMEEQKAAPAAPVAAAPLAPPSGPTSDAAEAAGLKRLKVAIPLRGMRKAIADNMWRSLQVSAQMTSGGEVDASELIRLRQLFVEREQQIGVRITYTDILVFMVARALRHHPLVNASIIGNEIRVWDSINIGVATFVELDQVGGVTVPGLVVPVVRDADQKTVVEIHQAAREVVEKARQRKLLPDDTAGSTFTVTNPAGVGGGGIREGGGSSFGTPIINQPEVAILGIGAIVEKPVVHQGQIVARPLLGYSFTHDHRIIDGVAAGGFLGTLAGYITHPYNLLLELR